jgi:hypothetical protein
MIRRLCGSKDNPVRSESGQCGDLVVLISLFGGVVQLCMFSTRSRVKVGASLEGSTRASTDSEEAHIRSAARALRLPLHQIREDGAFGCERELGWSDDARSGWTRSL